MEGAMTKQGVKAASEHEAANKLFDNFLNQGFKLESIHDWCDQNNELSHYRARFSHPDGRKEIRPFHKSADGLYHPTEPHFEDKKPLYGAQLISQYPEAIIWVVEGEKCADCLSDFFKAQKELGNNIAITSGGATSANHANWSSIVKRRTIIFPDNDAPGINHATEVAIILQNNGCSVDIIDVSKLELKKSGDVVDWLQLHVDASLRDLLLLERTAYRHAQAGVEKKASNANQPNVDEPWHEPVDLEETLNEISIFLKDHCILPGYAYTIIPLWVAFTYCIDSFHVAPILAISSPEKRCGKTTLITILQYMVLDPLSASNITPAATYRIIEQRCPTLIIDEGDTFLKENEEMRGVLNSGHTRDMAVVIRCVGKNHEPTAFKTFCPKIVSLIGRLPDTLEDRSIVIHLKRKKPQETIKGHFYSSDPEQQAKLTILRSKLVRFADDNQQLLAEKLRHSKYLYGELQIVSDRMVDNVTPLLLLAQNAGDVWLSKLKSAILTISSSDEQVESIGIKLLRDIQGIFRELGVNRIHTKTLIEQLCKDEESEWRTYKNYTPISPNQLAKRLREFGISSKTISIDGDSLKGYELRSFEDAFERYIPNPHSLSVNPSKDSTNGDYMATDSRITDVNQNRSVGPNIRQNGEVDGLTDQTVVMSESDAQYITEERAAIMEYDGGLSKDE